MKIKLKFNHPQLGTFRSLIKDGKIWFVAKDIADILQQPSAWCLTKLLKERDISSDLCQTKNSRLQPMNLISVIGLHYSLFHYNKPVARKLQEYFVFEIMPALYEHIDMNALSAAEIQLSNLPQIINLKRENGKEVVYNNSLRNDLIQIDNLADILALEGCGREELIRFLRDEKLLRTPHLPYQKYLEKGYFEVVEITYEVEPGFDVDVINLYVTPKGQNYIRQHLLAYREYGLSNIPAEKAEANPARQIVRGSISRSENGKEDSKLGKHDQLQLKITH